MTVTNKRARAAQLCLLKSQTMEVMEVTLEEHSAKAERLNGQACDVRNVMAALGAYASTGQI